MHRNIVLLSQFIREMCLQMEAKRQGLEILAEDELQRGVVEVFENGELPIWVVFACQLYLDIRYILEEDVDRAQAELLATGQEISNTIGEFFKYAAPDQADGVMPTLEKTSQDIQKWCLQDIIGVSFRNAFKLNHSQTYLLGSSGRKQNLSSCSVETRYTVGLLFFIYGGLCKR